MRSKHFPLAIALSSILLFAPLILVLGQDNLCPATVEAALIATNELCDATGRDEACYGHILLDAEAQPGTTGWDFDQPGDIVDVSLMRSMKLSALDLESGAWGIARMHLRADLPANQPENVTVLVFGDVTLDNAYEMRPVQDVTVSGSDYVNVRRGPSASAGVVGTLSPSQTVTALGRLTDSSWLRVELPDTAQTGWVYAPLLEGADLEALQIDEAWMPYFGPMQAFYFQSGQDDAITCAEVPASGLLIQTPEGAGEVTLLINEVNVRIGSTVFFSAQAGGVMTVATLEGRAQVEVNGVAQYAFAGTQVTVPLSADLSPNGPPTAPEPYDQWLVGTLPVSLMPQIIPVIPPLTEPEIAELQNSLTLGSQPDTPVTLDDCPGNSCDAPGQGGDCPGNSCDAPGQGGGDDGGEECPGNSCDPCPGNSCNAPGHNKSKKR